MEEEDKGSLAVSDKDEIKMELAEVQFPVHILSSFSLQQNSKNATTLYCVPYSTLHAL